MKSINTIGERKLLIKAGYSEAYFISEALSMYHLRMAALHVKNSEEEIKIDKLRNTFMDPTVKITCNGGEGKAR